MTLTQHLETVPPDTIIGYSIRLALQQGRIDEICDTISDQARDCYDGTIAAVGQDVLNAVLDYKANQI